MNLTLKLPIPTQEELKGLKVNYYERICDTFSEKNYGLDIFELGKFIHHTYEEMFLNNKHITLGEFKKIVK